MTLSDLQTPVVLIDLDRVEANLIRAQTYATEHGLTLRPHIKTHRMPRFAERALALGAVGITCQKLGEAEVMADAGLADILLTYNIVGAAGLARLAALHERIRIAVVADHADVVAGYAARFADAAHPLTVLVECDTGAGRCGVQSPEAAVTLARQIAQAVGLRFGGLMTYPPRDVMAQVEAWLSRAVSLLTEAGLPPPVISNGGSPDLFSAGEVRSATEHRPGTYIYSDRMQVSFGLGTLDDCALTVRSTVVSRPTEARVILDAGSKALAADLCPASGHGHIVEYPQAVIRSLSEEHAVVDMTDCAVRPGIGEIVHIIPNHACVVSNLFDTVALTRGGTLVEVVQVAARGKSV